VVVAQQLLEEGNANVDVKDNNGTTPLVWAAARGHEAIVRLLLENDANLDSKDADVL